MGHLGVGPANSSSDGRADGKHLPNLRSNTEVTRTEFVAYLDRIGTGLGIRHQQSQTRTRDLRRRESALGNRSRHLRRRHHRNDILHQGFHSAGAPCHPSSYGQVAISVPSFHASGPRMLAGPAKLGGIYIFGYCDRGFSRARRWSAPRRPGSRVAESARGGIPGMSIRTRRALHVTASGLALAGLSR